MSDLYDILRRWRWATDPVGTIRGWRYGWRWSTDPPGTRRGDGGPGPLPDEHLDDDDEAES
jgi:hypothetical protein